MLPDYEIKRATTVGQKIDSIILFVWMLLMMQMVLFFLFQESDQADDLRFRLIANSNTVQDQQTKVEVQNVLSPILLNYESAPDQTYVELEKAVAHLSTTLNEKITINKEKAMFPPKVWNEGITAQTNVESIVISIGKGRGDNWWCSLFPKVCYKDEEVKEEKPKFFVWEWLKKKFSS